VQWPPQSVAETPEDTRAITQDYTCRTILKKDHNLVWRWRKGKHGLGSWMTQRSKSIKWLVCRKIIEGLQGSITCQHFNFRKINCIQRSRHRDKSDSKGHDRRYPARKRTVDVKVDCQPRNLPLLTHVSRMQMISGKYAVSITRPQNEWRRDRGEWNSRASEFDLFFLSPFLCRKSYSHADATNRRK
jgi:hypothetical protein